MSATALVGDRPSAAVDWDGAALELDQYGCTLLERPGGMGRCLRCIIGWSGAPMGATG